MLVCDTFNKLLKVLFDYYITLYGSVGLTFTVEGHPLFPVDCLLRPVASLSVQGSAGIPINSVVLLAEASHLPHP